MSLNTNGWDFGYHITLDNANLFIKGKSGTLLPIDRSLQLRSYYL
jgi:hypothetical protein